MPECYFNVLLAIKTAYLGYGRTEHCDVSRKQRMWVGTMLLTPEFCFFLFFFYTTVFESVLVVSSTKVPQLLRGVNPLLHHYFLTDSVE